MKGITMRELFASPFFYAALVAIAAFTAAYGSYKIGKIRENLVNTAETTLTEIKKVNERTVETLDKTNQANTMLEKTHESIQDALTASIAAKEETINAQNNIIGQITGGASYPRISIGNDCFYITVNGEYSIPELNVEIIYLKDYAHIPSDITENYTNNMVIDENHTFKIHKKTYPKLWRNSKTATLPIPEVIRQSIATDESSGFDINFTSAYKRWVQKIRFIKHADNPKHIGIIDYLIEENPSAKPGDHIKTKTILTEISANLPTMFVEEKSGSKHYTIFLYNIKDQHLKMYQPNFVVDHSDELVKLATYESSDFTKH